ncbi:hypothetical protein [Quadrisphaera setariae]|uniref:Uncharacterized protein n=1 Tax=Quadrisphaera setariae TaxID=2593304 RepID=A0A5C8ZGX1_9ACTN|nr:hypothetical protein [Quadrisphaera setariae]TXR56784.1 hypothetical protein FMM08_08625 [Quadrisphaera setariae]
MHVTSAHHRELQRVYREALAAQVVVVLSDEDREDLSWNLADVTASSTSWEAVRAALVAELAHRGVGEDHGEDRLAPLADALLHAVQAAPDPTPTSGAAGGSAGARHTPLAPVAGAPWTPGVRTTTTASCCERC